MRRWNGWGDDTINFPLTDNARAFLRERVGPAQPPQDVTKDEALAKVPASRLEDFAGATPDAFARLTHAHAQSFVDWWALRTGRLGPFPDAVAYAESHDQVAALLAQARGRGAVVIPYGGGTSVVGHLTVPKSERPVLSLDLSRLNRLTDLNEESRLATFGAGVAGPDVEAQLRARGYMLGHLPQSFELASLGGWIVTRSSGQQSLRYGRIEQMFAGARLATPKGEWTLPTLPATGAGTDVRDIVLGSEGRIGVLTEARVRVRPVPEREEFHGVFMPDWGSGKTAIRELAQTGIRLSMLRLSNAIETDTQLQLAGHPGQIKLLRRYLQLRGRSEGMCMLLFGATGTPREVRRLRGDALCITRKYRGVHTGTIVGKAWAKNRFRGAYVRNTLWEAGYGVDTIETAVDWPKVTDLMGAMEKTARAAFAKFDEKVHAFTHLSHVYPQGSSIYSTFVFRLAKNPDDTYARWRALKTGVSEQIVKFGGTISHQHGVGLDHRPYLPAEKGALGIKALQALAREFDPDGMMNPGKLVE
ncbi:MAG: FAD-binding oxidoreductase [Nevskiales bacterium]